MAKVRLFDSPHETVSFPAGQVMQIMAERLRAMDTSIQEE